MRSGPKPRPLHERFAAHVEWTPTCWIWRGNVHSSGYGHIREHGRGYRVLRAHRVSYEIHNGPIPEGLVLDHLCRNTRCVNPDHLEAVTQYENMLRGEAPAAKAARRDTCINGHPYTEATTEVYRGYRYCLVCRKVNRRHRWLTKAA